ncbi:hypothetical protein EIN_057610 [Entamoeba invadens IP1]|uniref:hypothetical protein n=1 Tax=Entamoeba invadens IP1 TaxID=370355 RepID=UPI0002C3E58E|nr:hypothetical protein EIN_057610 [Entamoeba invadens IP1]ELP93356.1 hypothetical protein EIN_057610 [Entamoeba invadens IP1]|eukprot:XP_004260127.1 hypothetical protein EIN_057610 [Entamoeba invadens IP1]
MSYGVSFGGELGELTTKDRNAIPRVCHFVLTRLTPKIPIKNPKNFFLSFCGNRTKDTFKALCNFIVVPDSTYLSLNATIFFSYLHYFRVCVHCRLLITNI